jgi:hypothetical protein
MKLRKGEIPVITNYDHLRGKLRSKSLFEDLGIEFSHPQGSWQMYHCPNWLDNHKNGDANPSFGFNEKELRANCFVCGQIDLIDLVKICGGITDDAQALQFLEAHSDMQAATSDDLINRVQEIMHPDAENVIMPDYNPDILNQWRFLHPYLKERGITDEIAKEMLIGYNEEHDAIVIPLFFQNKLRGWQLRHLSSCDVCPPPVPKYKSTKNLPKIRSLYGYDRMLKTITAENNFVIVVESPMTVLKLLSLGFDNVVATFGSFSREQGMLLQPIQTIFFWGDNDGAGYTNTQRCIDTNRFFNSVRIVPAVPGEKSDPANLNTREEVERYLNVSYPSSLFAIKSPRHLYEYDS